MGSGGSSQTNQTSAKHYARMLDDPSEEVRQATILQLSQNVKLGSAVAAETLSEASGERGRCAAIEVIGNLGSDAGELGHRAALRLHQGTASERQQAVKALMKWGQQGVLEARQVAEENPSDQLCCLSTLQIIRNVIEKVDEVDEKTADWVASLFDDDSEEIREDAIDTLSRSSSPWEKALANALNMPGMFWHMQVMIATQRMLEKPIK